MQFSRLPEKKSFWVNIGAITCLTFLLVACGGGTSGGSSTADIHPGCTPGSNTQFVKLTSAHKVAWSQNALDGAWRFAEEASIED